MKPIIQSQLLSRAGFILILIVWIESMISKLVLFKEDTALLDELKKMVWSQSTSAKLWNSNQNDSFRNVINRFRIAFPHFSHVTELLEEYMWKRNVLAHFQTTPGQDFLFIYPRIRERKKDKEILFRIMGKYLPNDEALKITLDQSSYDNEVEKLQKFDKEYFPAICNELGIKYENFRWID